MTLNSATLRSDINFGLSNAQRVRLYRAPSPIKDETASSWIFRVAEHYEVSPQKILKAIGWKSDVDTKRSPRNIDRASFILMHDQNSIEPTQVLAKSILASRYFWPLTRRINRSPICRYCPQCLAEDKVPFLRVTWRTAFAVACEQHRIALSDRCPACTSRVCLTSSKVVRVRNGELGNALRYCYRCGTSLTEQSRMPTPRVLIHLVEKFQRTTLNAILFGHYRDAFGGKSSTRSYLMRSILKSNPIPELGQIPAHTVYTVNWMNVIGFPHYGLFMNWLGDLIDVYHPLRPPFIRPLMEIKKR